MLTKEEVQVIATALLTQSERVWAKRKQAEERGELAMAKWHGDKYQELLSLYHKLVVADKVVVVP